MAVGMAVNNGRPEIKRELARKLNDATRDAMALDLYIDGKRAAVWFAQICHQLLVSADNEG